MPSIWIWKGLHAALPQHSPVKVWNCKRQHVVQSVQRCGHCSRTPTSPKLLWWIMTLSESWILHSFYESLQVQNILTTNAIIWLLPLWISNSRSLSPWAERPFAGPGTPLCCCTWQEGWMILNDNIYYIYKYYTNYTNNKCWKCWQRKTDEGLRDRCSKRQLQDLSTRDGNGVRNLKGEGSLHLGKGTGTDSKFKIFKISRI